MTPYVVAAPTEIPWGDEIAASGGQDADDDTTLNTEATSEQNTEEKQDREPEEESAPDTEEASGENEEEAAGKTEAEPILNTEETAGREEEQDREPEEETVPTTEAVSGQTEEETTGKTEEAAAQEPEDGTPQSEEIVEEVDLDAEEATPIPEMTDEPEIIQYEELAGWVILNDSEEALQWTETEENTPVVRSPRMERNDEDYRISLDDLVKSVEGWELHDETDSLILEAYGYTLALLNEKTGLAAMMDGTEIETDVNDFSFEEGHFIRVDFLTRALEGSWEWDTEEETLMILIPEKGEGETSR